MNRFTFLQLTGIVLTCLSGTAIGQSKAAHTYTDQELKAAGWTTQQIATLRTESPPPAEQAAESTEQKAPIDSARKKQPDSGYISVFDDYVPFDYVPDIGWREANDRVGEIGGWRAYLEIVQEAIKLESMEEKKQ